MAKIFIGPMSKNVVDAVIAVSNAENTSVGLIPSRRQVEYNGGYVNNWTTKRFAEYVRENSRHVILQRDHGGALQGDAEDDGLESFRHDAESNFDLIHIDPWKKFKTVDAAAQNTMDMMRHISAHNSNCRYEVGTEEAIRRYEVEELETFLKILKENLEGSLWEKIEYAVIQGGTGLLGTANIGVFDETRCAAMIAVCASYGLKSKEHNGDFLALKDIGRRFELGLDGLNIAPEFGGCETECILDALTTEEQLEKFFRLCYDSRRWVKWMPRDFTLTKDNRRDIINVSGHYVFSHPEFVELKSQIADIDSKIQKTLMSKLSSIISVTKLKKEKLGNVQRT